VALDLAGSGIVVLSIDFRNAPEAPYPASLQDINYGIRWLKAHASEFGSSADRVGLYGTSSGGHQVLLTALRPADPRYKALPLSEAPNMDARVAFVISGRFRDFCGSRARRQAASRRVVAHSPHPLPRKHEDHQEDI
jgi:acetyl esterase/lipase